MLLSETVLVPPITAEVVRLVLFGLATATLSFTVTKALIFRPARIWVGSRSEWLGELITCPYCFNHWVSLAIVAIYRPRLEPHGMRLVDWTVSWLAIAAIATYGCGLIGKSIQAFQPPPMSPQDD